MTHIRLLPTVLIAVIGLFCIKLTHLVAEGGFLLTSTVPAQAQEAQEAGADVAKDDAGKDTGTGAAATEEASAGGKTGDKQEPPALIEGMKVDPAKSSRSELAILERLARRRDALAEREQELDMRDALLKAAEKRLQKRVDELKTLENSIKKVVKKRDAKQDEDLGKLVAMYQSMKPKQAARIFEVLEPDVLLDVVKIMNPRKVAAIMGEMSAAAAGSLSLSIAKGKSLEEEVKSMGNNALPQIGN